MKEEARITDLLGQWRTGSDIVQGQLVELLYPHLRAIAANRLRLEPQRNSLETSDLVQDALVKLLGQDGVVWNNRAHFFAIAALVMRRILVDHARRCSRVKHGANIVALAATDLHAVAADTSPDWVAIHLALEELGQVDPQAERVVEFRFFAGMTHDESAQALNCSRATVERRWRFARAWLAQHLGEAGPIDGPPR